MTTSGFGATDVSPIDLGPVSAESVEQIDKLLADGFPTLRFPADLEQRFKADTAADRLIVIMISAALVTVLFNGYLLTDKLMIPDVFSQALVLRTGLFTPVCLLGLLVLIKLKSPTHREVLILLASILAGGIGLYLTCLSTDPLAGPYLVSLAVTVMFSHSVTQMRFWLAVVLDVITCTGIGIAMMYVTPAPIEVMIPVALVILSTITFTLFGCYTVEHEERQNWLLRLRETSLLEALKTANDRLDKLSRSDLLTQVANRRHFDEFLNQVWERAIIDGTEVSLIMIDVDHFKAYNDVYGHPAGDACLRRVAATLKRRLRRPNDVVARFGGEEFIAVLSDTPLDIAAQAADRVRIAIERLQLPHKGSLTSSVVTASIGVATMRPKDPQASQKALLIKVDEALYKAKTSGRNRIWPDPLLGDPL